MSTHIPTGSPYHQASGWMLIISSIILFFMVLYKLGEHYPKFSVLSRFLSFMKPVMTEQKLSHLVLYIVLFALVFASAMSFFID